MIVILKSAVCGEDGPYTIGAIDLPDNVSIEAFEQEARVIMSEMKHLFQESYEDSDLMAALERRGYKIVDCSHEIVVRD